MLLIKSDCHFRVMACDWVEFDVSNSLEIEMIQNVCFSDTRYARRECLAHALAGYINGFTTSSLVPN